MAVNIIVDGIIDAIRELKEAAKCPFCDGRLEFEKASKSLWRGDGDSFILICTKCHLDFTLRRKKNKWGLEEVRRSYRH